MDVVEALMREGRECHASVVKETMHAHAAPFDEGDRGYRSFGKLLEDAAKSNLIKLRKNAKSGTWVVEDLVEES